MVKSDVKLFLEYSEKKKIKYDINSINVKNLEIELFERDKGLDIEFLNFNFYVKDNFSYDKKIIGNSEIKLDFSETNILVTKFFPKKFLKSDNLDNRIGIGSKCYFLQLDFLKKNYNSLEKFEIYSLNLTNSGRSHLEKMGLAIEKYLEFETDFESYYNIVKNYVYNKNLI